MTVSSDGVSGTVRNAGLQFRYGYLESDLAEGIAFTVDY